MRFAVETKTGTKVVNSMFEAVLYFQGFYNDMAAGKSDEEQKAAAKAMITYLLATGKIRVIEE